MLLLAAAPAGAEIIDGVAAVVGRRVITFSDIRRQVRVEAFFGRRPAPETAARLDPETRPALERLIEWRLIRQEMDAIDFPSASDEDAGKWLAEKLDAPGDPAAHGLTRQDLVEFARRQLDFEQFVELRFKAAAQVSPPQVEAYYERILLPDLKRKSVEPPALEELRRSIENTLREERANQLLDEWLIEQRTHVRIRILEAEE